MISCRPIGYISTPFETREETPAQGSMTDATGVLEVKSAYVSGLDGLTVGQRLDVIWFADQADRTVVRYPDRVAGVFALRTVDRPNSIGITTCTIDAIDAGTIVIEGVDMLDDTPVIDLKPAFCNRR